MAIAIARPVPIQDAVPEPKRWTVDEYLRLFAEGFLPTEGESFELIQGQVLKKLGQNQPHISCIVLLSEALRMAFGTGFVVVQQLPVQLGESNRPEPDVLVLRGQARDFAARSFAASDVALVVEVADSRLDTARGLKVEIYARNGIQEYWIVDLRRRALEVRQGPIADTGEWTVTRIYSEGEEVTPFGAGGKAILVSDLLPAPANESDPAPGQ